MTSSAAPSSHANALVAPITPRWPGETFVCVGSGWSLTLFDLQACRGQARVIVINDAWRVAPWADVLYAADASYWQSIAQVPDELLPPLLVTISPEAVQYRPALHLLNWGPREGLSLEPTRLVLGGHSGPQAINLAVHLGPPKQIVLLGYDMQRGPRGQLRTPLLGERPNATALRFEIWTGMYQSLVAPLAALNIPIVNCSRRTAITAFPRRALADVLA